MTFATPCPGTYGALPALVTAPVVQPYAYGALTAYTIIDDTNPHERNGIVYKSPACQANTRQWVDDCNSANVVLKSPTDVDKNAIVQGCPFHLYTFLSCKTTTLDAMFGEANEIFDLREAQGIEAAIWKDVLATPGTTIINTVPGPAGALGIIAGVAALESAMACCYPGVATIHGDRGMGIFAGNVFALELKAGQAFTPLGTRWAFYGCGLNTGPDGVVAPPGYAWLYATSQMTLRRFPKMTLPDNVDQIIDYTTNEPRVVVERTYVPSIECCKFAILVTASCACS